MNRNRAKYVIAVGLLLLVGLLAYGVLLPSSSGPAAAAADSRYLLDKEPAGAAEVMAARKDATDGQDVVVVGRIGGRVDPWVKDSAAFSLVDRSLKPCSEMPGDMCPTPWDYCCESTLPESTVLVLVHDADGKLVKTDAQQLLGVTELDTVVVEGRAKRDKDGNVSIVASKMYVAPNKEESTP
jgi:hypothetical protein